jgi:hypothetical protein
MIARLFGLCVLLMSAMTALACGSGNNNSGTGGSSSTAEGGGGRGDSFIDGLESLQIVPASVVLSVTPAKAATQTYKVIGKIKGKPDQDVTARVILVIADTALGLFNGAELTSTTVRGGSTTVEARANGGTVRATAGLISLSLAPLGPTP